MDWEVKHIGKNSSTVLAMGYNTETEKIAVFFHKGACIYMYQKCTPEEWDAFKEASSKGKYVHAVLRKKAFEKISL